MTINCPESYLEAIEKLVGEDGLYPSRSELIRCAVREFLIKELKMAKSMAKYKEEPKKDPDPNERGLVRVPVERLDENSEPVREFRTYKIVKRLDYNEDQHQEKPQIKRRSKKKKQSLGNPFWDNKLDRNGNIIRVPKRTV